MARRATRDARLAFALAGGCRPARVRRPTDRETRAPEEPRAALLAEYESGRSH
jgi:hypothetical protein